MRTMTNRWMCAGSLPVTCRCRCHSGSCPIHHSQGIPMFLPSSAWLCHSHRSRWWKSPYRKTRARRHTWCTEFAQCHRSWCRCWSSRWCRFSHPRSTSSGCVQYHGRRDRGCAPWRGTDRNRRRQCRGTWRRTGLCQERRCATSRHPAGTG